MLICGDLPADEQKQGTEEDAQREKIPDKNQRCKHHRIIPIVNSAACTAFVLHKPGLKGAEEQNADHVANRERKTDQEQNPRIDDMCVVQHTDRRVERDPH